MRDDRSLRHPKGAERSSVVRRGMRNDSHGNEDNEQVEPIMTEGISTLDSISITQTKRSAYQTAPFARKPYLYAIFVNSYDKRIHLLQNQLTSSVRI
jgi:hypothetical protein